MKPIAYDQLPGLEHIYLEDSFLLGCSECADQVSFSLDLVLTLGHPDYTPARSGEQHCYRTGRLIFSGPTSVAWNRRDFAHPATDASGKIDYGAIDEMTLTDGVYRLEGAWGEVEIRSDPPSLELDPR